ncbi:hypothetical protein BG015_003877 [Linnemannia schmuckeri]|uniref:Uncharacterized protein n=1 Tax=Linnemannia schmuckeri TaxID=64567 RepID=A0A9P5V1X8_9FUNG|nr:hypothetical protein BG015_003877 [Linnemannia schmuckeri]
MRTSATLASSLVLLLLATAATLPSLTNATPCEDCIIAGIYAASPTCDAQIFTNPFQGGPMTERQKSCFCPLASSDTWLQQCVTPELCTTKDVNDQYGGFKALKAEACSSTVPGNTTITTTTVTSTTTSGAKPPSSATATATSTSSGAASTSTGASVRLDASSNLAAIAVVAVMGLEPSTQKDVILWDDILQAFEDALHVRQQAKVIQFMGGFDFRLPEPRKIAAVLNTVLDVAVSGELAKNAVPQGSVSASQQARIEETMNAKQDSTL